MKDKFSDQWRDLLESLILRGTCAGADLVEVFLERTDHIGLLAEQDTITSVSPSFSKGAGLRVFRDGRDGFVSTNDLSDSGLLRALDQALAMLGLETQALAENQRFQGLGLLKDHGLQKDNWLSRCPELDFVSQRLLEGTVDLNRLGRHLQVRRGSYSRDWQEVLVAASDGTFARDVRLHQSTGLLSLIHI